MILASLGAFFAASVQSATGFGFALVVGPVMFAVMDPEDAIGLLLVMGIALNLLMLFGERRRPAVQWTLTRPLLLAAAPGVAAGVFVLQALSKPVLQIAVGATVIGAALLRLRTASAAAPRGPLAAPALGFASGLLTTSTNISGPPLVFWLSGRGLRPEQVRDSLAASFLVLSFLGVAAVVLLAGAARDTEHADWLLVLLPAIVAGHALGRRIFGRLDARRHDRSS